MRISFESSTTFESISRLIFDSDRKLETSHRLYLHTWFVRYGVEPETDYEPLVSELLEYFATATASTFLRELTADHPRYLDWFGKPLVGNPHVRDILSRIRALRFTDATVPSFVDAAKSYVEPLGIADRLQEIVGEPYPKPDRPLRYVISEYSPSAYNVYPDTIVHFQKDNPKWYVAGYGHEAGHLLTWSMCRDPEVSKLCHTERTRGFSELVATLLNKLLLDAYGIACNEVFTECTDWNDYIYEKNPGKPLFDAMAAEIQLGSYSSLHEECIRLLHRFQ